jgi:large subunit ribosomal protein L3
LQKIISLSTLLANIIEDVDMALSLMGKKRGMLQVFDDKGNAINCTVIEVEPNVVAQIKTEEKDGYRALQLAFDEIKTKDPRTAEKRVGKPIAGHFKKSGIAPRRHLHETRINEVEKYSVGQEIGLEAFADVPYVDISGTSKGKGYQGVMKRHNFAGGPAAHGSGFHRHAGSRGQRTTPGRVFPLGKAAGHMGSDNLTILNLKVVMIDDKERVLVVKGAVPGPNGASVTLSAARKKK